MAPSFISMLMADKSPLNPSGFPTLNSMSSASTASTAAAPSTPALPHLVGRSGRPEGLQFGLPMGGFQRSPFGHPAASAAPSRSAPRPEPVTTTTPSSSHWSDRQKVQDFFRNTNIQSPLDVADDEKAAQGDSDQTIDVRALISRRAVAPPRLSSSTSSSSSDGLDNQQEELGGGRLHSALADLLAARRQEEADDEPVMTRTPRKTQPRRPNASALEDLLARQMGGERGDNQQEDEDSSPFSSPARSRNNSEDFFSGTNGLFEMLSQRHMPVGEQQHESLADMLAKRAPLPSNVLESAAVDVSSTTGSSTKKKPSVVKDSAMSKPLAEMLAKRTAPIPANSSPKKEQTGKTSALEVMLAKRAAPTETPPAVEKKETSEATHPLAAMLKRRQAEQQAPVPSEAPEESSPSVSTDESSSAKDLTPLREHPTYEKYFKMLKVGLPLPVVKHKMQSENVDPSILDLDPNQPLPETPKVEEAAKAEDNEAEAAYQTQLQEYKAKHGKYVQMVKVGLPPSVVEHKMRMDGVDPAWLHGPPKKAEPKAEAEEAALAVPTEAERMAHRKKYHKYFQMLRMGLPRGAVEQKMRMAGVDPKELDGPRVSASPAADAKPKPSAPKRQDSIRKKLHWEGKKHDAHRDSLWAATASPETKSQVQISAESRAILEKLFVKSLSESKKRNASGKSEGAAAKKKKAMIQLIDMKKSQNVAITLARVKLSFPELKREILAMNPTVLSTSQLQSLMDMWPDRKEQEAIDAFQGDLATIGAAEKFLVEVRSVPRFREKLGCLVFKQEFPSRVHELRESLGLVIRGVHQVCSSEELRQLFIYILQIGNLLNLGGDADEGVEGFSLNSLVKFSQTKAFVGGITFLQYVVQSIERDVPHLARFYDGIDLVAKCSKVSFHSLASEKNALEAGWKNLLREAEVSAASIEGGEDQSLLNESTDVLQQFCKEVEAELTALKELLDQVKAAKAHFLEYFEEEETGEELDVLLSHIAGFTAEYRREHKKYQAKMKKDMMGLYSKFSPSKNPVERKSLDPKTPENKVLHGGKHPHGHGHHHRGHGHSHEGRGGDAHHSMPPQSELPHRVMHHARVLKLEMPADDEDLDDVLSTASMSPKTSAALSAP